MNWRCFKRGEDAWAFVCDLNTDGDDPGDAARRACIENWAEGEHYILVVGPSSAHEFQVTVETEQLR
jgi:hypothetical protein